MTGRRYLFATFKKLEKPVNISIGNETIIQATGKGSIDCMAFDGKEWHQTTLHNGWQRNPFSGHPIETQAILTQYPPIICRKSSEQVVTGAEMIGYKLKLVSPCDIFKQLKQIRQEHVVELKT
jgi:hypothetical protein